MYNDAIKDTFAAPKDSQEFQILSALATVHKTAREKNLELFQLLKSKGVQFNQIKKHLFNEAQRCGLWNKAFKENYYSKKAWYVQVLNFCKWVAANYTSFDQEKVKAIKAVKTTPPARQIVVRKEVIVPSEYHSTGPKAGKTKGDVGTEKTHIPTTNPTDRPSVLSQEQASNPASSAINEPLKQSQELSIVQIQQIIFTNLSVLAERAKALDATMEWNALMTKMGLDGEIIPFIPAETLIESIRETMTAN